ncbi:TetR/AcrR family transcriptional regulator [Paenibacillus radicis (ex Xue et al. 2023)]|uniref:TetR/AcrR family transcriptional regulator n=1 Tax=Paenibacillus radicis (ex Xue et al. 2023) TaxID=2972489 RepID=A0ABT1YL67_9BACL|nr:TetR/AcrR family transcriptional regulator [Paenibacillus radicis (ex Xue et al. 2023)]MCR8633013.1 TetR/AcrR family transcriptional regulator [Paenibacillus radicis (ex Xue et al. 2023)]
MNNPPKTVISRRSRPAKEPLSKDLIVKTALELLKNEGSAGLSMRKIAKALDTGPSSLYVYVTNLQELSAYVLDYGLDKVVFPSSQDGSWKTRLFDVLNSYLTVLYESPGIAELSLTTIPIGPHSLAITEYILQRLQEGGIHSTSAAWGADLLLLYASSVAFEQSSRDQKGTTLLAISSSYQSLDAIQYPMIASLRNEMTSSDGEERFRWGLEVILHGILLKQE